MTSATPSERSIFLNAIELTSASERQAYLDGACGDNPALRAEVEALLLAHERPLGLLDLAETTAWAAEPAPVDAGPGSVVGPYRLLHSIGEGGMGVVYEAEQTEPLRRLVALKVIRPGMDSHAVLARFDAERHALALMDHPNIARVLDAGTTPAGRPYFVMELVQGAPITRYCDDARLSPRQRLELFIPVCQAIQHAHQKGIIHRDIKPSNVLVTEVDGKPVPKVIDFGVAKAVDPRLTERTAFTRFGVLVGTPEYMSPEQAGASPDIDTRTDVYSLGVLLYELLTGVTPLDRETLRRAAFDEVLRRVREEEPQKPSTRLSGTTERLPTVAALRATEPRRLARLVRGDLDWVVMKALEKDRARRYESASGLASDLQRHLDGDPVEAGPPSRVYRLRRFARKHRAVLVTVAVVALMLALAAAISTAEAMRASRAEAVARSHQELAEARTRLARRAVDQMFTRVAEEWLGDQPGMEQLQREFLEEALGFYEQFAREQGSDPAVQGEIARALRRVAEIQFGLGQFSAAEASFRRAVAMGESLVAALPDSSEVRYDLVESYRGLGRLLWFSGPHDESAKAFVQATAQGQALVALAPGVPRYRFSHAMARVEAAETPKDEKGDRELEAARAILEQLLIEVPGQPEYRLALAKLLAQAGSGQWERSRFSEAERYHRQALDTLLALNREFPARPRYRRPLVAAMTNLARDLESLGRKDESESFVRRSIEGARKLSEDFPAVPVYRLNLAIHLKNHGSQLLDASRSRESSESLDEARALLEALHASDRAALRYRELLAKVYLQLGRKSRIEGRIDRAEAMIRDSLALLEGLVAEAPAERNALAGVAECHLRLGDVLRDQNRFDEAERAFRQGVLLLQRLVDEHPDAPRFRADLTEARTALERFLASRPPAGKIDRPSAGP